LTQKELADILGLKPTAICNYESRRNEPSIEKIVALSEYFDVSCDYLLGVSDAYLPVYNNGPDNEIVDFFQLYQRLNKENIIEVKNYMKYLLYKQEKSTK
jgi:Predicted transcriptional regulators